MKDIDFTELLKRAKAFRQPEEKPNLGKGKTYVYQGERYTNLFGSSTNEILTPEELAQRLKVSVGWIKEKTRSRNRNPIPHIPMGRFVRFEWNAVVVWLEKQATERDNAIRSNHS